MYIPDERFPADIVIVPAPFSNGYCCICRPLRLYIPIYADIAVCGTWYLISASPLNGLGAFCDIYASSIVFDMLDEFCATLFVVMGCGNNGVEGFFNSSISACNSVISICWSCTAVLSSCMAFISNGIISLYAIPFVPSSAVRTASGITCSTSWAINPIFLGLVFAVAVLLF